MNEIFRYCGKILVRFLLCFFKIFPIKKNRILLLNECNFQYSDSPRCIAEYLQNKKIEIIFSVHNVKQNKKKAEYIHFVKFGTFCHYYYALTACILLTNDGGVSYLPKRKKQIIVNTWHGGGAYKKVAGSVDATYWHRKELMLTANNTNIFISSGSRFTEVMSEALCIPKEKFWEIGLPRNDMLVNPDINKINIIRENIGLKKCEKLLLYAPTFRKKNDSRTEKNINFLCDIDCELVCNALSEKFGGKWVFGFRVHPSINRNIYKPIGDICDLSNYDDMQELLLTADVLITDYSSSVWDYMLLKKPIFLYAEDMKKIAKENCFYTPIEKWPFSKAANNQELKCNILKLNSQEYYEGCNAHYRELGGCETGNATKLLGDFISSQLISTDY